MWDSDKEVIMDWITTKHILGVAGLPSSVPGIHKIAEREAWEVRQRKGVKGKSFEYKISSLPPVVQAALLRKQGKVQVANRVIKLKKEKPTKPYCREVLWSRWNQAGANAQEKAKKKLEAVQAFYHLVGNKTPSMDAYHIVSKEYDVAFGTLRRDCKKVKNFDFADWLPVLLSRTKEAGKQKKISYMAHVDNEAWEFFKADYLRLEQPAYSVCYERLKDAAKHNGWTIPSIDSLKRRLKLEVPQAHIIALRKGERALFDMYPTLERTVEDLHAMEWVNGDGYLHNVRVKWFNGEDIRPKTWFWQDIYSRKIIAWRTDVSENTDSIRLSLMDCFDRYGIPKHLTIDNTRAAANKWLTGGVPNRYRFKVKDDDPLGLIPSMGIQLHWTSVQFGKGHGQAKPIERAFGVGGLEQYIDLHPALAGCYTGANPMAKPDNYGERVATAEKFLDAVTKGVEMFNAKMNRETEICKGFMSFNDAFNSSYEVSPVVKATPEQMHMMMLQAEAVRVSKNGEVVLTAGGTIKGGKNRYHNQELFQYQGKKVIVRFDPQNLHGSIEVYTLENVHICTASCIEKAAFGDTQVAREHNRKRTQFTKATNKAAQAQKTISSMELAAMMKPAEEEVTPETKVVGMFRPSVKGNTALHHDIEHEEQHDNEYEHNFSKSLAAIVDLKKKNQL